MFKYLKQKSLLNRLLTISIFFIVFCFFNSQLSIINLSRFGGDYQFAYAALSNQNQTTTTSTTSNRVVEASFTTSTKGGTADPNQYYGNTNNYLNKMIQCTGFKADINDPACQQLNYSASFQSFVKKNFNQNKVNEIINNIKPADKPKDNKYIAKTEPKQTPKPTNKPKKELPSTGPETSALLILISLFFLLTYCPWTYLYQIVSTNLKKYWLKP